MRQLDDVETGDLLITEIADKNFVESQVKKTQNRDLKLKVVMAKEKKENISELSFEQTIKELSDIVTKIEQGQIPLQESLQQYERGMSLIKHCRGILEQAEMKIDKISEPSGKTEEENKELL